MLGLAELPDMHFLQWMSRRASISFGLLLRGALDAQFRFSALRIATNMGTFPVVLKEALKLIGHDCGDCVKPIQPLNDEQRARLKTVLTDMGLL